MTTKSVSSNLFKALTALFLLANSTILTAKEPTNEALTKSGYSNDSGFGSPFSVRAQLEEDNKVKEPVFRLPAFKSFFDPWYEWKADINEQYGLELGLDYSTLYQGASDSLSDNDNGISGVVRFYGRWTLFGRGTGHSGTLVFKGENRHRLGSQIAPAALGFEVGYNGITGTLYSDVGTILTDLYWAQYFNNSNGIFVAGRFDPNDFMDVSGYANPWTSFQNLAILLNTSIALPDVGVGFGIGHWFNDQWVVQAGFNDANGAIDKISFYDQGAEFFKYAEVGWSPSKKERFSKNVHITVWHVDQRNEAQIPDSHGVALSANWTFNQTWMSFIRAGWSRGGAPLMNATATAGVIHHFTHGSDLVGLGLNWGKPSDSSLRDQYTTELFYRIQIAQNLAITPSIQLLINPALNPEKGTLWVGGIRARFTL